MRTVRVIVVLQILYLIGFSESQSRTENGVINRNGFDTRMLDIHNYFRKQVTKGVVRPCAEPMPDLTWNSKLAYASEKWAKGCAFKHDKERGYVGENLAFSTSRKTKMVRNWFNEYSNYSFTPIDGNTLDAYGHYTQIVWESTTELGCYINFCKKLTSRFGTYNDTFYLVCRYSPPGNFLGELPYTPKKC